jgi:predicted DCC family thiol-disulfide oxidoreductase YuxK
MAAPTSEPDAAGANPKEHPILFFDGVCNLCNASVDFVIRHDKARLFRFASLQGETARKMVPEYANDGGLSTVVLLDADGRHVRSTAALRVLKRLGVTGPLAGLLLAIPRPVRDAGYRLIAQNRYRFWGKKETCRLPSAEERAQFLP